MKNIEGDENKNRLNRALDFVKEINLRKEGDNIGLFLNFFKKNFDALSKQLQNVK
jgi:hypothetical protein